MNFLACSRPPSSAYPILTVTPRKHVLGKLASADRGQIGCVVKAQFPECSTSTG